MEAVCDLEDDLDENYVRGRFAEGLTEGLENQDVGLDGGRDREGRQERPSESQGIKNEPSVFDVHHRCLPSSWSSRRSPSSLRSSSGWGRKAARKGRALLSELQQRSDARSHPSPTRMEPSHA